MDGNSEIEIRVTGKVGTNDLTPGNFDITEIKNMIEVVENLLYPVNKKGRPIISYELKEGSVLNVFKTSKQGVILFAAVISMLSSKGNSIDDLDLNAAKAFEWMQQSAMQKNYIFSISTSESRESVLQITPQTRFLRSERLWTDAELYYYGVLTDAGGKDKVSIHLDTKTDGLLIIRVTKDYLSNIVGNPLYRSFGVRVKGQQNIKTGEVDKSSLELISLIDYNPKYDEDYLNSLIEKSEAKWKSVDVDSWLNEIRGGFVS